MCGYVNRVRNLHGARKRLAALGAREAQPNTKEKMAVTHLISTHCSILLRQITFGQKETVEGV
jgi:hypothetical protein